ncbi:MAG: hypothetical protein AAGB31_10185, partial [Bdellovibrio sp.]
ALNNANASLDTLGFAPKEGATYSPSEASADISSAISEMESALRAAESIKVSTDGTSTNTKACLDTIGLNKAEAAKTIKTYQNSVR